MSETGNLGAMAWVDVPTSPLVLVPLGSTEQHGPHLPFSTDTTIAVAIAEAVATSLAATGVNVIVAPALAYGASGEHQGFPGTLSVGRDALRLQLIEMTRSAMTWAARVVFINGHGGNVPTLSSAVVQMRHEQHDVAWLPCAFESGADAHAGATETAVMLCLAPGSVDMRRAAAGNTDPLDEIMPALIESGVGAVSPTGVLGDPTLATAERGAALIRAVVEDACARMHSASVDDRGRLQRAHVEAR